MKNKCLNCLKLISVKERFKIFDFLKTHARVTVNDLVKLTSLKQPTVSFHLKQLSKTGLLKKKKFGRFVFCQIQKKCPNCPLFN